MRERGILFSDAMVRAILDGRKTQTRRVVKLREFQRTTTPGYDFIFRDRRLLWNDYRTPRLIEKCCPYGKPGDRLWVRETWRVYGGREYEYQRDRRCVIYRAGGPPPDVSMSLDRARAETGPQQWRPSIFMPRWASRVTVEISDVRVQRLHDISEEDARAEGCSPSTMPGGFTVVQADGGSYWVGEDYHSAPKVGDVDDRGEDFRVTHVQHAPEKQIGTARDSFRSLWLNINGNGAWAANPWVWALTFRRVDADAKAAS